MKYRSVSLVGLVASIAMGLGMLGCAQEVSHTEESKPGWFGGSTHKEETTYKNPDGTYTTVREKNTTK